MILSLKNPIQNIYISAAHLNDLKSIDYRDKDAGDLTDDEIKIIASRYNIGHHFDKNDDESGYSKKIYANKQDILNALS